jgi:hypothetical protein
VPEQATAAEGGLDTAREREETRRRLREAGRQFVRRTCPEPLSRDDIRQLARIVAAGLLASKLDADRGLQKLGIAKALRAPKTANRKQHDAPEDELQNSSLGVKGESFPLIL